MQITFNDLNPFLTYYPSQTVFKLTEDSQIYEAPTLECIKTLQDSYKTYEGNIKEIFEGTLQAGQIRINGEIKTFSHVTFDRVALRSYVETLTNGAACLGLSIMFAPMSYLISLVFSLSTFVTVPVLIALAAYGIYIMAIKAPPLLAELKIRNVINAQNYYIEGPLIQGKPHIEKVYEKFNAFFQNKLLKLRENASDNIEEIAKVEEKQRKLVKSFEEDMSKLQAVSDVFEKIRHENREKASQLVAKLFSGTYDPDVLEFQARVQLKFTEATAGSTS